MRPKSALLYFIVSLFAFGTAAQTLTIGNPWAGQDYGWPYGEGTFIDLVNPAQADGVITRVGFALGVMDFSSDCPDVAAIKFFREVDQGYGTGLTLIAERAPVSYFGDYATVAIDPPVRVLKGDLIGIRLLTNCGQLISIKGQGRYLQYPENITGTVPYEAGREGSGSLVVWGTGSAGDRVVGILPVVGSAPGLRDSHWMTSLQLMNPSTMATTGRLIFRRSQTPGSEADSSMSYALAPGETKTFDDIMFAMNETGVGSIDLASDDGVVPIAVTTIFNDAVGAGNFGLMDMAVDPEDHSQRAAGEEGHGTCVLRNGDSGFLIGPASAGRARFNIGVRTLGDGAVIEAKLLTSSGSVLGSVTREYPPNFMEQMGVGTYFALPVIGGETVRVTVRSGSAIVYGSTVDNGTNDPAIQYVHAIIRVSD